ncbi:unnamed protein product [Phytophthora lilii]|uniref:Unnamed protein product n=1 Tax=Phytophthora lilii TaxID=2077276 RepID=A0A9W6THD7_9STRA|nr:unnamed protein product [Phytophthora lilii]
MPSERIRIIRLSSTRATTNSFYSFQWRIESILKTLGGSANTVKERKLQWEKQRSEQIELFVSGVADTYLLLQDLKSAEERVVLLRTLKTEIESPLKKYSPHQRQVMQNAFEDIASKIESDNLSELTPEWFIPWYELIVDEWSCLGSGGFGSVYRAKWLDSDVVVKQVRLLEHGVKNSVDSCNSFQSSISPSIELSANLPNTDTIAKKADAMEMFRREVDIWFGFSHPHVVRLFGACHVGRPFFVCEYVTNGTLVSYLQKHPDQLWTKLYESALGVQYLHARGVVHGDLKWNNIVIGSDMKAKVTDFGLSSIASNGAAPQISAALCWVAPECLVCRNSQTLIAGPTFASDVYSLGMCILESLRVVEAVMSGQNPQLCLPWCNCDISAVRYHVTNGRLPSKSSICDDKHWKLIERMCAFEPKERIKISTVVDELAKLTRCQCPDSAEASGSEIALILECVPNVISAARMLLFRFQGDADRRGLNFSLYISLWEQFEVVYRKVNVHQGGKWRATFCQLVTEANVAMSKLQDVEISFTSVAETTFGCYTLQRKLEKFQDTYEESKGGDLNVYL